MYGGENDEYELQQCVIIGPKGLYYSAYGLTGAEFDEGKLYFVSNADLKKDSESGIYDYDISNVYKSVKKMQYIMSADDMYGTASKGNHLIGVNISTFWQKVKNENNYVKDWHSPRQYAIWKNINPILNWLRINDFWDSNKGQYNDKVEIMTSGDDDGISANSLYELAEENYESSKDYVAMWFFKSIGENSQDKFYQDIMIGGKLSKKEQNETSTVSIKKTDKDNKTISNAGFVLFQAEKDDKDFSEGIVKYASQTNSSGIINFIDLNFYKYKYRIYEYAAASEYKLDSMTVPGRSVSKGTFKDANGVEWKDNPYFDLTANDKGNTIVLENEKITGIQPSTLKIKKIDESGNAMSGVKFAIATIKNDKYYFWKMLTTESSGEINITGITPGNDSRYAIFEYTTLNGYSLNASDITVTSSNNTVSKVIDGTFYDALEKEFNRPLCLDITINSSGTFEYTVKNKKTTGGFTIKKIDRGTGNLLTNVWTGITSTDVEYPSMKEADNNYYAKKCSMMKITTNGYAIYSNLKLGNTYAVWEYNNHEGYKKGFIKIGEITIKSNYSKLRGTNSDIPVKFSNNINTVINTTYSITVTKYDKNNKKLPGIYFDLFYISDSNYAGKSEDELQSLLKSSDNISKILKAENKIGTAETNTDGIIEFTKLPNYGTYILRETDNEDKRNSYQYTKKGETQGYSMNIGKIKKIVVGSTEYNCKRTMKNDGYGGLNIKKIGNNGNVLTEEVVFKLYQFSNSKLVEKYTLKTSKSGIAISSDNQTNYGVTYSTNYCIKNGIYYLFEYSNKNEGYNVKFQGKQNVPVGFGYGNVSYVAGIGAYIKQIKIDTGKITSEIINNEQFGSVYLYKYVENKQESDLIRKILPGAAFQLYQGDQIIKLRDGTNVNGTVDTFTSELTTDKKFAKVSIERIPVGTYTLYETSTPEEYKIDMTIQPGYDNVKKAVKIATVTISKNGEATVDLIEDIDSKGNNNTIKGEDGAKYRYRRASITNKKEGTEVKANIFVTNRRYINISGYVWEDIAPSIKQTGDTDNLYTDKSNDIKLEGITVRLYNKNTGDLIAKTNTSKDTGEYKFSNMLLSLEVKQGSYYVEFDYKRIFKSRK